ncbi:MAG: hypothetical protein KTR30_35300 [Saprospiraceae bacterium]|nr:hypothetical protein [Saprospiraceae bacterium]
MAKQILLQIDYLKILRRRKHWNIYFTIATTSPNDPTKMVITALPENGTLKMTSNTNNELHFVPEGDAGGNGLFVFQHDMPAMYSTQVRLWVMQSRKAIHEVGNILHDISNFLSGSEEIRESSTNKGVKQPWLTAAKIANQGIGGVGSALSKLDDRDLGFVNMDEHFGHHYDQNFEQDYHNQVSTGYAEIGWTWQLIEDTA